jgi:uncharacterized protein (DUF2252 family)
MTSTSEEIGREARKAVPRSSHGDWTPVGDRDLVARLIDEQEADRLESLLPIRHERMSASSFAFYRGSAVIQAADLASQPNTGLTVQCCGDAHLANFGGYAAPDRDLVFDLNDFDETNRGPFEWDVKRLAVSFVLASRSTDPDEAKTSDLIRHLVRAYREAIASFASMRVLDVWYSRLDTTQIITDMRHEMSAENEKRFDKNVSKAMKKNSLKAFSKLTEASGDGRRIISDPPMLVPLRDMDTGLTVGDEVAWMQDIFDQYASSLQPHCRALFHSYRPVDTARKVVGVGSVGTRCWIAFLVGRTDNDPLFLQVKEANRSVLEPHTEDSPYANHGERVVEGQRLLQASSDILLGWFAAPDIHGVERHFYVRQLWDGKLSPDYEAMGPRELAVFAELCGRTLARAHARSGDPVAISAYLGTGDTFDEAIAEYSLAYARQNDLDYQTMVDRWSTGSASSTEDGLST